MQTIIAHSDLVDTRDAARDILSRCDAQLAGARPRGGILFATTEYDHGALLAAIDERWPGLPLVGASTAGELSSHLGYRADSVCLTLLCGEDVDVRTGNGLDPSRDLDAAIESVVDGLGDARPVLAIILCPATVGNPSDVVRVLHEKLGERACPIVGGLAGDHSVSPNTRQFFGRGVHHDSVSVMFLCGDLEVSWGVSSGWFPIGAKHRVTRSVGNKIFEIDDRPALDIYQSFWGDRVNADLGEFPLAVALGDGPDDFVLRAAMSIDKDEGSVTFAGDVPQGSVVSLTEVVPDGLLSGTETSAHKAVQRYHGKRPDLALLFTCAARKWVLGSKASEEVDHLNRAFGEDGLASIDFSGFYAFGEICPLETKGPPLLHNETCVTVLVGR